MSDDLFAPLPPDPGLELIVAGDRTYRLALAQVSGQQCLGITWAERTRQGVVGGYYTTDQQAMAAVEHVEAHRAKGTQ